MSGREHHIAAVNDIQDFVDLWKHAAALVGDAYSRARSSPGHIEVGAEGRHPHDSGAKVRGHLNGVGVQATNLVVQNDGAGYGEAGVHSVQCQC